MSRMKAMAFVHFGGHRLALLRRVDQLCSHGFDFPGGGFIVADHSLGSERADARNALFMLDVVRHRPRWGCPDRGKVPDDIFFKLGQIQRRSSVKSFDTRH